MPHWKLLVPKKYFSYVDIDGKEATVKIARIVRADVEGTKEVDGKLETTTEKHGLFYFDGIDKPYILTVAVGHALAMMFGEDGSKWVGHSFTFHCPMEKYFGEELPRLRVRGSPEIKSPMSKVIKLGRSKYKIDLVPTK